MVLSTVQHVSQFWPDVTRISAAIGALSGSVAAIISALNRGKIVQVHSVVNGQFTAQVQKNEELTNRLEVAAARLATSQAETVAARANQTQTSAPAGS